MKVLFHFFAKRSLRTRRMKFFLLAGILPVLVLVIIKTVELVNPASSVSAAAVFSRVLLVIYIQLLIPILGLFLGTSLLQEEVDNKTLVLLTTSSISKPVILLGKFMVSWIAGSLLVVAAFTLSFIVINLDRLMRPVFAGDFFNFIGVALLALMAYMAFFTFLAALFKKALIFGLVFIFGWESVVQYFPGSTQKFTVIHYVKSLLPESSENIKFLMFRLEPSALMESLITLTLIVVAGLVLSMVIFKRREYRLGDNAS